MEETASDKESELLKERLERQEANAKNKAALMEEIQKILDKLDQEAFEERMEEASKSQKGSQRNMQQLLELTKQYYVQQKTRQLSRQLENLSKKQDSLTNTEKDRESLKGEKWQLNE